MNSFARALLVVVFCAIPFSAFAQLPDLSNCYAETAYDGTESLSLLTVPDGSGNPFTEAYLPNGITVDATITVYMINGALEPIAGFPGEDLWLGANDGGMNPCQGGAIADEDTGADGSTHWTDPLNAGGYSEGPLQVYISGDSLYNFAGFNIRTNSPDINGDGSINLMDVGIFAPDFFEAYNYRSDFVCDGVLNLADVGKMAVGIGASCP